MAAKIVRSDPAAEGIRRRRCGRGFSYLGTDAVVIKDARTLTRIREVICRHLEGRGLARDRVLAASIRLIDLGFFRPGGATSTTTSARYPGATTPPRTSAPGMRPS